MSGRVQKQIVTAASDGGDMTAPHPLVESDVDLRTFPYVPLDAQRLRDSRFAAFVGPEEFRCAIMLWCASWHQIPAASLPDDDIELAVLSGFGRAIVEWQKVRNGALYGWITCSDGRLYHPVLAGKASEAWESKLRQRWQTECARIRKHNQRHKTDVPEPDFQEWRSRRKMASVQLDTDDLSQGQSGMSQGRPGDVQCETASNRTEQNRTELNRTDSESSRGSSRKKSKSVISEDWKPDADGIAYALSKGLSNHEITIEAEKFLCHFQSNGDIRADWSASWRKWILNAVSFRQNRVQPKQPSHIDRNFLVEDDF